MASPFHVFRKYQKAMLATATIMAMFAFVFVSPFARFGGGPGGSQQQVYAKWSFGDIYQTDVDQRVSLRTMVNDFFSKAVYGPTSSMHYPVFPETARTHCERSYCIRRRSN